MSTTAEKWTYLLDADGDHGIYERERLVAVTAGFGDGSPYCATWTEEEDAAHARLIAAAPQMVEALKIAFDVIPLDSPIVATLVGNAIRLAEGD